MPDRRQGADARLFWMVWMVMPLFVPVFVIRWFVGGEDARIDFVSWLASRVASGLNVFAWSFPFGLMVYLPLVLVGLVWLWRKPARVWRRAAVLAPVVFALALTAFLALPAVFRGDFASLLTTVSFVAALCLGVGYFYVLPGLGLERLLMGLGLLARDAADGSAGA